MLSRSAPCVDGGGACVDGSGCASGPGATQTGGRRGGRLPIDLRGQGWVVAGDRIREDPRNGADGSADGTGPLPRTARPSGGTAWVAGSVGTPRRRGRQHQRCRRFLTTFATMCSMARAAGSGGRGGG
jgi:hypothetical protein